ncbi:hypothetical protein L249_1814 [Ophiocordyceps polyrhachis-furcata BCC 54312]|uniref:Fungal lipase-type domain-containing protein n=1 Tax=Ophiocordyceps polyrhachis-furcata BCC 54312 TaxID=1330021 RepID=A0A367LP00_9HYPO|nr:hypothetical protein L249_1814 [Ophiocordyceps polyrhachis-furcata BCC 54312]
MGFFSSRKGHKSSHSFTDPPNVYFTPAPPMRLPTAPLPVLNDPFPNINRPWTTTPTLEPPQHPPSPWLHPAAVAPEDDMMLQRFDRVLEYEQYTGQDADDLFLCQPAPDLATTTTGQRDLPRAAERKRPHDTRLLPPASVVPVRYLAKVQLYINSKLPMALPPLTLDTTIWPLICLAAQCSLRVYSPPSSALERRQSVLVPADRRSGSKAMYIRSVPADAAGTVVLAVRGTASLADWFVNLRSEPTEPTSFLDDAGNACHAGFLSAARAMIRPAADRLRLILSQDPARASHSLVLTGHSAGGAVAALLYMHMLADGAASELSHLASCFRRVHCVTFGAPPVSLLPLVNPSSGIFLSFVNEGDPVARADKAYVKSLLALLASPPPPLPPPPQYPTPTFWPVPPSTLSNAGHIVVLRGDVSAVDGRRVEAVEAVTCREDQLRGVIWGDPVCHWMSVYAARVETLAAHAVAVEIV